MAVKNLLVDEYKIVYGIEPSPAAEVAYKKLVMEEFKADREAGKTKAENLVEYITKRIKTYDDTLAKTHVYSDAKIGRPEEKGVPTHETKVGKEVTARAREDMFQTNLSFNGKDLPRNQMTLQKFTTFANIALGNDGSNGEITKSHDNTTGRSLNDGRNGQTVHVFDIATGKANSRN
jgi:hypothetical protein